MGPKSRTERPRKTKIGTEVAHVARDSDTTFKVKRSKVNLHGAGAYYYLVLLLLLLPYNYTLTPGDVWHTDASGHVRLWHYSSRRCLYALDDDRDQTLSMSFSPPGDRFATVGADPKVFLYDVETKKRIAELEAT